MRDETTFLPPRTSTTSSTGINTRPIWSCKLNAATRLSRLSLTFFSKPEYVWMMYHCIPIDLRSPSDAELLEHVRDTQLDEFVDHRKEHAKESHRGDHHPGGRDDIFAARPGYLLHLHANVVQEFARVRDRAADFFADSGRCSGDGVALRFFVLHFCRLRGHESSFSPVEQTFLSVLFICVRPANAKTLAGEEGLEPPYPVLETGVLAVGRLP